MELYIEKYMSLTPQKIAGIKISYPKNTRHKYLEILYQQFLQNSHAAGKKVE